MAKQKFRKQDLINGRISLLFFWLLALGGLLWLESKARYRYDLVVRHWLTWLLPTLFGVAALLFGVLLFFWFKGGKKESKRLFSLPFLMILPLTLMAAFILPWLMDLMPGWQFFQLGTKLVFYAAFGGFIGYIGYYNVGKSAGAMAAALTLDALLLFYFYDRFLAPSSWILNTSEFGYLPAGGVAIIMAAVILAVHLAVYFLLRKEKPKIRPVELLLPGLVAILALAMNTALPKLVSLFGGTDPFGMTAIRWMIFGTIGAIGVWYIVWCVLKKKNIL